MGEAVVVGEEEFGLAVVARGDVGDVVTELEEALAGLDEVARVPVKADAFVVVRLNGGAGALVEHEAEVALVEHAEDEPAVVGPHLGVHAEAECVDPKAKGFGEVGAGNDGDAVVQGHRLASRFFHKVRSWCVPVRSRTGLFLRGVVEKAFVGR